MDVCVAEDDPLVREVLAAALEAASYEVMVSANAEEALAAVEASEGSPPSVWVVDIELGYQRADGFALAEEVFRRWPQAGVVYVTAYPHLLNDRQLGPRERACAKPCDIARLTTLVGELIDAPPDRLWN